MTAADGVTSRYVITDSHPSINVLTVHVAQHRQQYNYIHQLLLLLLLMMMMSDNQLTSSPHIHT